jgi:tetratricopeptide (TPR) repeat protein
MSVQSISSSSIHTICGMMLLILTSTALTAFAQSHYETIKRYQRGKDLFAKGDLEEAIAEFNRVIESYSYPSGGGQRQNGKQSVNRPPKQNDKVITLDPLLAAAHHDRGVAYIAKGDVAAALTDFDNAIAINPRHIQSYLYRGAIWDVKSEPDKAYADFDLAVRLDPNSAPALVNRGAIRGSKGELISAIADFNRAINADPRYSLAYSNRGLARQEHGDIEGAFADYNKAIALDIRNAHAWANRGIALFLKGERIEGEKELRQSTRLNPKMKLWIINRLNKLNMRVEGFQ